MQPRPSLRPDIREVAGIAVFPAGNDSRNWYAVPPAPRPERDAQGFPVANLWITSAGGILQLGLRWDLSPARMQAVGAGLAAASGGVLKAQEIDLQPPPVQVEEAFLRLETDSASPEELVTTPSSGAPPWSAVINLTLGPDRIAPVLSAFRDASPDLVVGMRGHQLESLPVRILMQKDDRTDSGIMTKLEYRSRENLRIPFESTIPLCTWFPDGSGARHVRQTT